MNLSKQAQTIDEQIAGLKCRDEILKFASNIEKGDIVLGSLVPYAWIMYGFSRIGKTSTGHMLAGNPVKGIKCNGQIMVTPTTSRNSRNIIGNTMKSETLVPNFFEIKSKNQKYKGHRTFLIDTPGYGDNRGILKIFANGYYHYRLYSKVQNMKFILVFDYPSMSGAAANFIATIIQFTKSFSNYLEDKEKIWESVCFLFTKVDTKIITIENIVEKLEAIVIQMKLQEDKEVENAMKQLIKFIIKDQRIFFIKRYAQSEVADYSKLLADIDNKVKPWWHRQLNPNNPKLVDMNGVALNLAKDIVMETVRTDSQKEVLKCLIQYYNLKIKQFLSNDLNVCSLPRVLNQLVKDAMGTPQSHEFLGIMNKYVEKQYSKYDKEYENQREKIQKQKFQLEEEKSETTQIQNKNKKLKTQNYLIKKHTTLANIEVFKNEVIRLDENISARTWVETCESKLYDMIKEFNRVSHTTKNRKIIIYKYGYLIYRIIEEMKIFMLLIESASDDNLTIIKKVSGNTTLLQLKTPLQNFLNISYVYNNYESPILGSNPQQYFLKDYTYQQLRELFCKNFEPNSQNYNSLDVNEAFVEFFVSVQTEDEQMNLKIAKVILKYSDKILNEKTRVISLEEKRKLVKRLVGVRVNCNQLYENTSDEQIKKSHLILIRKLTKNLGRLLEDMGQAKLAIKVYDTIRSVDSVCKIYERQIDKFKESESNLDYNEEFELRIEYIKYLQDHFRIFDALKFAQQTYEIADGYDDLTLAREKLSDIMLQIKKMQNTSKYEDDIFNQSYFESFSEELEGELNSQLLNECEKPISDKALEEEEAQLK